MPICGKMSRNKAFSIKRLIYITDKLVVLTTGEGEQ